MTRHAPRFGLLLAGLVASPGCLILDKCKLTKDGPPPPSPDCRQVVTTWSHKVQYAPDTVHNGAPMPGFVGRMYLFGEQVDFPQVGDGGLTVELYDDTAAQSGGTRIEVWNIDKVTLKRLLKKDTFGWGYTLFLPWSTYRPDLTRVHLTVQYAPDKGTPIF